MRRISKTALVLGGGNALGAYHAGAYEGLHRQEVRPDWIVGASIGAVTGAILAGNPPEERLEKLQQFWAEATQHTYAAPSPNETLRQTYNGMHSVLTLLFCRPNIFQRRYPGLWSMLPWVPNDVAIYDHSPLRSTLERLVDFDRLNRAEVRLTVTCVDLESGDEVYFDNTRDVIGPEHILASTAITPAFPPVNIGGRLLCDPGYANNLPLDPVFDEPLEQDLLCIAIELFSLRSPQPASLDAVLERTQDILFATPARRSVKALKREYELREQLDPKGPRVRLLHLAYQAASHELATKTFDFSPSSIADRRAAGERDMARGLSLLEQGARSTSRFGYWPVDTGRAAPMSARGGSDNRAAPAPALQP
jgi:NTE family protein